MATLRSSTPSSPYRGRFAPSPTGALHFGSLLAALTSYLCARSQQGTWLVRMEDLDPPREVAGAADDILRTLEALGLHWDEAVLYQSRRTEAYEAALQQLQQRGLAFPCACTRSEIAALQADSKQTEPVYPGTCRNGVPPGREPRTWRARISADPIEFVDRIQGPQSQRLDQACGDFVVRRADALFAYQLAVVVDDAEQGITDVVRGADLLDSTPRQIHLQRALGLSTPAYAHLPIAVDRHGQKLSKQSGAPPVQASHGGEALWQALHVLAQRPPATMRGAPAAELVAWAVAHWDESAVPRVTGIPVAV